MSRPRYGWWGYVKDMIRRYPKLQEQYEDLRQQTVTASYSGMPRAGSGGRTVEALAARELPTTAQREFEAVRRAIELTARYRNGPERLKVIRLVFWDRSHTLEGAAMRVPCSARTARRYHTDFIMLVAKKYGLLDEVGPQEPSQGGILGIVKH